MTRTATEILRSLVADIEAMQAPKDITRDNDSEPADYFGPFEQYARHDEDGAQMCEAYGGVSVEWPNLRILLNEARAALAAHDDAHSSIVRKARRL